MAPALLAPTHYTTTSNSNSNIYSAYSSEPSSSSTTTTTAITSFSHPRTAVAPSLPSPALSDRSSSSNGSGSGSLTPTQRSSASPPASASALMFAQRKLSKKPSNSALRVQPVLPDILEASPMTPTMHEAPAMLRAPGSGRPLSVLSEVSIASDGSDGSQATIDAYKFRFLDDDLESVVEGSVFDNTDSSEEEDFKDLKRAEKAFAGVKQKLFAFENNIARARDTLLSPPPTASPTFTSSPILETSPTDRIQPSGIKTLGRMPGSLNYHNRTVSESASSGPPGAHRRKGSASTMTSSYSDQFTDAHTNLRANSAMSSRSRSSSRASSTQVKELEDQMNSLRGRLTQLTEKTRRESLRRRSMNNLRTPLNNIFHQPDPKSDPEPEPQSPEPESSVQSPSDITSPVSFHTAYDESEYGSDEGSRAGTPKPYPPIRKVMSYEELGYDSAFSAPGDETPSFISNPRRNRVQAYRSNSSSGSRSSGASTPVMMPLHPPPPRGFHRNNSTSSIGSFETAAEDYEEPTHVTPLSHRPHHRRIPSAVKASPLRSVLDDNLRQTAAPGAGESSPHDDGYHSGPSTPQGSDEGVYINIENQDGSQTLPLTKESLKQMDKSLAIPGPSSRARSATNSIIGAENDELALKLPAEDRELVENLCDQLGKVCCKLETARTPLDKAEIRRRMEVALMVLQGTTDF
ncbi:hypothetical protein H072_9690 [Dactylellina haptotyla CBS 200.50]|uniref:Uncharacterized protein n=1 Tax=Dactylellina haptotyla (strain CBS 200.50) TaxID=1284197 RepID=S8BBY9_DACHA|nr:hypothetical protein H072_9690 [Dactylellina haptotyla CBS 200.50]